LKLENLVIDDFEKNHSHQDDQEVGQEGEGITHTVQLVPEKKDYFRVWQLVILVTIDMWAT
jgi:hypothetical protein